MGHENKAVRKRQPVTIAVSPEPSTSRSTSSAVEKAENPDAPFLPNGHITQSRRKNPDESFLLMTSTRHISVAIRGNREATGRTLGQRIRPLKYQKIKRIQKSSCNYY